MTEAAASSAASATAADAETIATAASEADDKPKPSEGEGEGAAAATDKEADKDADKDADKEDKEEEEDKDKEEEDTAKETGEEDDEKKEDKEKDKEDGAVYETLYQVEYNDGDKEELSKAELLPLIKPYQRYVLLPPLLFSSLLFDLFGRIDPRVRACPCRGPRSLVLTCPWWPDDMMTGVSSYDSPVGVNARGCAWLHAQVPEGSGADAPRPAGG